MNSDWLNKNTILKVYGGSVAYGLNTPESDVDIRGICIPPAEYYFGSQHFEQSEDKANDTVIYSLNKFISLAKDCNPNIIEMLFTDPKHIINCHVYFGGSLINCRNWFLSKKGKHTFCGYAYSQLQRIKRHKKWIDNPVEEPKKEDFTHEIGNIYDTEDVIQVDKYHSVNITSSGLSCYLGKDELESFYVTTKSFDYANYQAALKEYNDYKTWKANRNKKRFELEEKYGYDTKHAMHCIRLMMQGISILKNGTFSTYLDENDRTFLLDIKNGKYGYFDVLKMYENYEHEIEEASNNSPLPETPDYKKIEKLQITLTKDFLAL